MPFQVSNWELKSQLKGELGQVIKLDQKTGCYTDGRNYVRAAEIRKYAKERMGLQHSRGKLPRQTIQDYFLDIFQVKDEVVA